MGSWNVKCNYCNNMYVQCVLWFAAATPGLQRSALIYTVLRQQQDTRAHTLIRQS